MRAVSAACMQRDPTILRPQGCLGGSLSFSCVPSTFPFRRFSSRKDCAPSRRRVPDVTCALQQQGASHENDSFGNTTGGALAGNQWAGVREVATTAFRRHSSAAASLNGRHVASAVSMQPRQQRPVVINAPTMSAPRPRPKLVPVGLGPAFSPPPLAPPPPPTPSSLRSRSHFKRPALSRRSAHNQPPLHTPSSPASPSIYSHGASATPATDPSTVSKGLFLRLFSWSRTSRNQAAPVSTTASASVSSSSSSSAEGKLSRALPPLPFLPFLSTLSSSLSSFLSPTPKYWAWEEWILGLGFIAAILGCMLSLLAPSTSSSSLSSSMRSPPAVVEVIQQQQKQRTPVPFHLREARPGVLELTATTLPHMLRQRPTFVMFYAPWCPYCQRMETAWKELAKKLHDENFNVQVARVDAYKYPQLTEQFQIPGFPTLVLFNGETPIGIHKGRRDAASLFSFVDKLIP